METAKNNKVPPKPVTIKDMAGVLKAMTSSPIAMFVKQCSLHQKMMLAAILRCIRREGLSEIAWRSVSSSKAVPSTDANTDHCFSGPI
jgi:origin recognition complex subunit 1